MEMPLFRGLLLLLLAVVAVRPDAPAPPLRPDPGDWTCEFLDRLEEAVRKDDPEAVRRVALARDARGRTALHAAGHLNLVDAARLLLDAGADPNAADEDGLTPLHFAVGPGPADLDFEPGKHICPKKESAPGGRPEPSNFV